MTGGRRWVVVVIGAVALALPGSAAAAVPGVNVASPSPAAIDAGLATGAKLIRFFVRWDLLEPSAAGEYPAGGESPAIDAAIKRINAAGAKPVFVVLGAPAWANGSADYYVAPDPARYADFFARFVAHTTSVGTVAAYEIWNEEDGSAFWHGGINPAAYAAIVKAAYAAAKPAAAGASILLGPTTGNDYAFIDQLYANGVKGSFDGVSVHTDTSCLVAAPDDFYRDPTGAVGQFSFLGFRSVHDVLVAHGDDKPIWMTELGWASTGGSANSCARGEFTGKKPDGVTEDAQAKDLTQAYACLAGYPYVAAGMWFTYADTTSETPDEINHYGLVHTNGSHKPSYDAFTKVVAAGGGPAAATCGDFTPPTIKVIAPVAGQVYSSSLVIKASVNDGAGAPGLRIRLSADGKAIRSFGALKNDQVASIDWQGAKHLADGNHTVKIEGFDANGNASSKTVTVCKGSGCAGSRFTTHVRFSANQPKCAHLACTLKGHVVAPAGQQVAGKVKVYWQLKRKGRWVTLHKGSKSAGKPFTFSQRLKQPGKWRVQVRYLGATPLKASVSNYKTFTAKR